MRHFLSSGILAFFALVALSFVGPVDKNASNYKVDPSKSKVAWLGKKMTGEHSGNVSFLSGALNFDGKNIKSGAFELDLNTITVTDIADKTYNEKLVEHLKGEDFFHTSKFPKATFILTSATPKGNNEFDIAGKLTIKGIAQEIKFPATVKEEAGTVTAKATVTVDRTKYDIKYGSGSFFDNLGDKAIDNNFIINLDLVAKK